MNDRQLSSARLTAAACAVALLASCSHGSAPASGSGQARVSSTASPAASPTASGVGVVAEVNGDPVFASELDSKVANRLARLRQEEFDIRQQALDEIISDRLLAAEAAKRGVSRDELLRSQVDAHASVSAAEVESLYEQNKTRFAGQPKEAALDRIRAVLAQRAGDDRQRAYVQELRSKARVAVRLEAPRTRFDVPAKAPATGPENAAITIVEFTDYQCPYCHRAQGVMDQILARYKGKVRLVHLDFPLEGHPGALPAARAARCAGEQGKFWAYHHGLMTDAGLLDDADLKTRASKLGLKAAEFSSCIASDRYNAPIRAEFEQGGALGVSGTPAYFVNGRMVSGAVPFEDFSRVIDAELAR